MTAPQPAPLPQPRGTLSRTVRDLLTHPADAEHCSLNPPDLDDVLGEDAQITLWMLYELHYRGLEDVDADWEWAPALAPLRRRLERAFEQRIRNAIQDRLADALHSSQPVSELIGELTRETGGPSVSHHARRRMTLEQWRELLMLKSLYQLKEADPHTWAIPRLVGAAKAAMVDIQYDEYGAGSWQREHSLLFVHAMEASGLRSDYGHYIDHVPAVVLATSNIVTLCALQRRLAPAAAGHLALYEASSALPCKRIAAGARRLGLPEPAAAYFDEHVEADAVHEQLATRVLADELAAGSPVLREAVLFGVLACDWLEARAAEHQLGAWQSERSALRTPA